MGIYKRKQESKKTRKKEKRTRPRKRPSKKELDQESDPDHTFLFSWPFSFFFFFFTWSLSWSSSFFIVFYFLVFFFKYSPLFWNQRVLGKGQSHSIRTNYLSIYGQLIWLGLRETNNMLKVANVEFKKLVISCACKLLFLSQGVH